MMFFLDAQFQTQLYIASSRVSNSLALYPLQVSELSDGEVMKLTVGLTIEKQHVYRYSPADI